MRIATAIVLVLCSLVWTLSFALGFLSWVFDSSAFPWQQLLNTASWWLVMWALSNHFSLVRDKI